MEVDETPKSALETALSTAVEAANTKKKLQALKPSLRHICKIITKAQKHPQDVKARRILMNQFSHKKFLTNVEGAVDIIVALGFVEDDSHKSMELSEEKANASEFLSSSVSLIEEKCAQVEEELNRPVDTSNVERKKCIGKCGFYGNPDTDGYCSICYRNRQTGRPAGPTNECKKVGCTNFGSNQNDGLCNSCFHSKKEYEKACRKRWRVVRCAVLAMVRLKRAVGAKPVQTDKRKCWKCRRKIGLTVAPCQCGYLYCDRHRSTLDHECSFNFRRAHKLNLQRANPTITGKKLERLDDV